MKKRSPLPCFSLKGNLKKENTKNSPFEMLPAENGGGVEFRRALLWFQESFLTILSHHSAGTHILAVSPNLILFSVSGWGQGML